MESKVCSICGKTLNAGPAPDPGAVFSGWQDVTLMDGNMVCSDCTEKVRILYPLRSSKKFVESGFRFGYEEVRGKTGEKKGWVNAQCH